MNHPIYIDEEDITPAGIAIMNIGTKAKDPAGRLILLDRTKGSTMRRPDPNFPGGDDDPEALDISKAWCLACRHAVQAIADQQRTDVKIRDQDGGLRKIAEHYGDTYLLKCFS